MMNLIRESIRPLLTATFALAFIVACLICIINDSYDLREKAFASLEGLTLAVVLFYYKDRSVKQALDQHKNGNGNGTA